MQLTISRLGHLGDGVAEADTGPTFVPRALPGELVEGAVVAGRMAAPRILRPVTERVRPPCPHYTACGGCAVMHASDEFVARWKRDIMARALAAHGLHAPVTATHVSPPQSRRRAVLAGRRLKKGVVVGFHARASGVVTAVPACRVLHPDLLAQLPLLEEVTRIGASRRGELALGVTCTAGGVDLDVRGAHPLDGPLRAALAALASRGGLARLSWDGELIAQVTPPEITFGRARVIPPPGAFLQATTEGEAALLSAVRTALGNAARVADLFAGCGTFALPLVAQADVHAVEADAAMLAAMDAGWRHATGLRRLTTEARDLFRRPLLPQELARFDALVIDPPRAGAEAQMHEIARSGVPVIAAVSCNPVTFARDAAILVAAGYRLDWVQQIDQFRWSPHVELAARLSKGHIAQGPANGARAE